MIDEDGEMKLQKFGSESKDGEIAKMKEEFEKIYGAFTCFSKLPLILL